jgi:two-component system, chemotaxis family, protein-glutamate methylesterase/glutaminase
VGVILTGMGRDGAEGLLAMRKGGARTLAQDEATSLVYGMPRVAHEIGAAEKRVPLPRITREIFA